MTLNTSDWNQLLAWRRQLAGEPDENSMALVEEMWRQRLSPDSTFGDAQLDEELVKLLEKIHHAF